MRLGSSLAKLLVFVTILLTGAWPGPGTGPMSAGVARADTAQSSSSLSTGPFKVCTNQTYALCAVASCLVLNGVSYCTCNVKTGNSISLPFHFGVGKDICSVNAEGKYNGYMASTYSLPPAVHEPGGNKALYTCPAATSTGASAQCDGGLCFTSTMGQVPPGGSKPISPGQIVCSCPITVANPSTAKVGYQIAGPYPCQAAFFKNCSGDVDTNHTGSTIYVGAPTGTARLLTKLLYGSVPPLHECHQ